MITAHEPQDAAATLAAPVLGFYERPENAGLTCAASHRRTVRAERAAAHEAKRARKAAFRAWLAERRARQAAWAATDPRRASRPGMNATNAERERQKDLAVVRLGRWWAAYLAAPFCDEKEARCRQFFAIFGDARPFSAPTMRDYLRRSDAYAAAHPFFVSEKETTPNTRLVPNLEKIEDNKRTAARAPRQSLETSTPAGLSTSTASTDCGFAACQTSQDATGQDEAAPATDAEGIAHRPLHELPRRLVNLARASLPKLRAAHGFGCPVKWSTGAALVWLARSLAAGRSLSDLVTAYSVALGNWSGRAHDFLAAKRAAPMVADDLGDMRRAAWLVPSGMMRDLYAAAAALPRYRAADFEAAAAARRESPAGIFAAHAAEKLRAERRAARKAAKRAAAAKARAAAEAAERAAAPLLIVKTPAEIAAERPELTPQEVFAAYLAQL